MAAWELHDHLHHGRVFRFPWGSEVKASACKAGDLGLIPGSGRSPGEGNGNLLQYSCLENPMGRGAWWATVHGVAKSRTRLSDFTSLHFTYWGVLGGSVVKDPPASEGHPGDTGSVPGLSRSPGERNDHLVVILAWKIP